MNRFRHFMRALAGHSQVQPAEEFTFENFDGADKVVVTTNLNRKIKDFDDPEVIRAILAGVKSHPTGWVVPAEGIPVARLRLNFYAAGNPLGNFGVDETFLTTHQAGSFWSKTSSEDEGRRLLDLIGLPDYNS
jgi:hypothetical protein